LILVVGVLSGSHVSHDCKHDASKLCSEHHDKLQCLLEAERDLISSKCLGELDIIRSQRPPMECMIEANETCHSSEIKETFSCLNERYGNLSQPCEESLRLSSMYECLPDALELCNEKSFRHGKVWKCLAKHYDEISNSSCKTSVAVMAFENSRHEDGHHEEESDVEEVLTVVGTVCGVLIVLLGGCYFWRRRRNHCAKASRSPVVNSVKYTALNENSEHMEGGSIRLGETRNF